MLEILGIVFLCFIMLGFGFWLGILGIVYHYGKKYGPNWEQVMDEICKLNPSHPAVGKWKPKSDFLKNRQGSNGNE